MYIIYINTTKKNIRAMAQACVWEWCLLNVSRKVGILIIRFAIIVLQYFEKYFNTFNSQEPNRQVMNMPTWLNTDA